MYLPASKKERKGYLEKVRTAVDTYKPKIEERTGANLGEVLVKDYKDFLDEIDEQEGIRRLEDDFQYRNLFERGIAYSAMGLIHLVRMGFGLTFSMRHLHLKDHSSIYVNFSLLPRAARILQEVTRMDATEMETVHELSHELWYALGGEKTSDKNGRIWNEGFATYCELDWFRDIYPDGCFIPKSDLFTSGKVYTNGRKKIENLVQECGEEVLLKIPSEWTKFDNQKGNKEK